MINVHEIEKISMNCSMTEFVGTTVLDTIGLVIPGVDPMLLKQMNLKKPYRSLGLLSSRTGAAGQINAVDDAGHLEFTFSANADQALNLAFDAPIGKPFGFFCGSPAAIGMVMADLAVKSASVEIVKYMTPDCGTSHSNEVIVAVTGDASAVKNAVLTARDIGLQLLVSMGSYPKSPGKPFLE